MIKPLEIGKFQEVLLLFASFLRKMLSYLRHNFGNILHIVLYSCRLLWFRSAFSAFAKL